MGKQVYIIHGYTASPTSHWLPWLKEQFSDDETQVSILQLPNSSNPKKEEWLETLATEIKSIDIETYFVAHSLGCITLLSYLDQLNTLPNFGGFILVSGFSEFIPTIPSLASFTEESINYKKINSATKSRVVVAAKDDSIVPFQFSQSLSNQLDASFSSLEKGGHFLEDDGFTTFPLVYNTLHTMMNDEEIINDLYKIHAT